MSRKHNTQHPERSRSRYPQRLEARGLSRAPEMPDLEYLRHKQTSDYWLATHPVIVANIKAFQESRS